MDVLVGFEASGVVREAFRAVGHDAWSCDLLPSDDGSEHHFEMDFFECLGNYGPWDLVIAHPPCRYISSSGYHRSTKDHARMILTEAAVNFFCDVRDALCAFAPRWCIENPVGIMSTRWRKPNQYVQPYEFGDDASKKTGFWLHNLPNLIIDPAERYPGRWVYWPPGEDGKWRERWSNQTDSGHNNLSERKDLPRWRRRSQTYPGIARAMAEQWG